MKLLAWVLAMALMLAALPAAGEFYKYLDEDGNTRFTDDINQVPPEQRKNVSSYVESESRPEAVPAEEESGSQSETEEQQPVADIDAGDMAEEGYFDKTRKELDEMKARLDAEYKAIMEEKEQLSQERDAAKTREQIQAYNKRVEKLNARAAAYEQKGAEYSKRVEEFNAKIVEQNSKLK